MGLDWCLDSLEADKSPLEYLGAQRCDPNNPEHRAIVKRIVQSHIDQIATNSSCLSEYIEYWQRPFDEILEDVRGDILISTIPQERIKQLSKEGIIPSLDDPLSCMKGIESFRGKRIAYCNLLPKFMRDEAYKDMTAESMRDYADSLEEYIPKNLDFDYEKEKEKVEKLDLLESDNTIPEDFWDVYTLKEAIVWLRFWSQLPVKLRAWY